MRRGEVWDVRLDPTEGTEQAGTRPAVIVSHDGLRARRRIIAVPFTTYRAIRPLYAIEVVIPAGDGGLTADSVALGDQVRALSSQRLLRRRGALSPTALAAP